MARRPSIRVRAALGAGLAAAVAFGTGALLLRQAVYTDRIDAAVGQAVADAGSIAEAYARRGPAGPVPDAGVAWTILGADNKPVMSTTGELDPYVAAGAITIEPTDPRIPAGTVTARLGTIGGDRMPWSGRLDNRTVTLVYTRMQPDPGAATVYVLASPLPAEDAVAALDRGFVGGLPVAVLLVALIAWMVTGRALRPVEAIRSELADISARRLSRRVPVPPTGDEIARLAVTTNATLDRLQRAIDQQRRFVADAAHELRSPLANLRNSLEVAIRHGWLGASDAALRPSQRTVHPGQIDWPVVVRTALGDTTRLQELTDDLLLLARLDRAAPPRWAVVDVAALVEEQVSERRHRGADRLMARTAGPAFVLGDEPQLARLLRNLLDNALRYSDGPVEVAVAVGSGGVRMDVSDKGHGIPLADRERVFERFTRLDDARDRDAGGTGLGLAIARDIATAHGGTIAIADADEGTRVVVRLPPPTDRGEEPAVGARPPSNQPPRRGPPAARRPALAVALGVLVAATVAGSARPSSPDPVGSVEVPIGGGRVAWAGGIDATHLYRLTNRCVGCGTTLLSESTDGGATWHDVVTMPTADELHVLGPRVLLTMRPQPKHVGGFDPRATISFDGGLHWAAPLVGDPIAAAPADAAVFCWPVQFAGLAWGSCALHTADPDTRRVRPLSSAPPLTAIEVNPVPARAGVWISGVDPATRRPAISVSHDGGRTWSTAILHELPPVTVEGGRAATVFLPEVVTADGRTAYACLFDGERWRALATRDGGAHVELSVIDVEKASNVGGRLSYATDDGTHLLSIDDGGRYLARSEGSATYRPISLGGVPYYAVVSMLPGGGYLAYTEIAILVSNDGWAWRRVWQE